MSLVVSDSGPIHYLSLCGAIEAIPKLYGTLVIPSAVVDELTHANTPAAVSQWITSLPSWAMVRTPAKAVAPLTLGAGERQAIALALEMNAVQLLVDDRVARRIARQQGLLISGTVGVLEAAASKGFLNLADSLTKLLDGNFRIDAVVVREALARDKARRENSQG